MSPPLPVGVMTLKNRTANPVAQFVHRLCAQSWNPADETKTLAMVHSSELGPTLPTWAVQQIGSYRWYTGRDVNALGKAAFDPKLPPTVLWQ
jgi:hypothetical protein